MSSSFYVRITGKWKQAKIRRFEHKTVEVNVYVAFILIRFARHRLSRYVTFRYSKEKSDSVYLQACCTSVTQRRQRRRNATQPTYHATPDARFTSCMFVHVRAYSYKFERGKKIRQISKVRASRPFIRVRTIRRAREVSRITIYIYRRKKYKESEIFR